MASLYRLLQDKRAWGGPGRGGGGEGGVKGLWQGVCRRDCPVMVRADSAGIESHDKRLLPWAAVRN